jgi:hypothetical protein
MIFLLNNLVKKEILQKIKYFGGKMEQKSKENEKKFQNSELTLTNRVKLTISGVEKVFESNPQKLQLQVAGDIVQISGKDLNVTRLDTATGVLELGGNVDFIKYSSTFEKGGLLKRIFK